MVIIRTVSVCICIYTYILVSMFIVYSAALGKFSPSVQLHMMHLNQSIIIIIYQKCVYTTTCDRQYKYLMNSFKVAL